jgi:hypothetical protein
MGDLANVLYKQFFLRDLLGKVVPGTMVLLALYSIIPQEARNALALPDGSSWYMGLIWFAFSLVLGLGLQVVAEGLGFHSAHPRPLTICFRRYEKGEKVRDLFRSRQAQFQKTATESQKEQRERYVYLKEGSGNVAFGLLFLAAAHLHNRQLLVTILIVALVLWYTHIVHRPRQAYYEIKVLDLLPDPSGVGDPHGKYSSDEIAKFIGKEL